MSDFITADKVARQHAPAPVERAFIQDDPDGRSALEVICDRAKAACLKASNDSWEESKQEILGIVDYLKGMCRLSGRDGAQARAEEVLMTVRICQSVEDIETANIVPELDRIRRIVGAPQTARGAMY